MKAIEKVAINNEFTDMMVGDKQRTKNTKEMDSFKGTLENLVKNEGKDETKEDIGVKKQSNAEKKLKKFRKNTGKNNQIKNLNAQFSKLQPDKEVIFNKVAKDFDKISELKLTDEEDLYKEIEEDMKTLINYNVLSAQGQKILEENVSSDLLNIGTEEDVKIDNIIENIVDKISEIIGVNGAEVNKLFTNAGIEMRNNEEKGNIINLDELEGKIGEIIGKISELLELNENEKSILSKIAYSEIKLVTSEKLDGLEKGLEPEDKETSKNLEKKGTEVFEENVAGEKITKDSSSKDEIRIDVSERKFLKSENETKEKIDITDKNHEKDKEYPDKKGSIWQDIDKVESNSTNTKVEAKEKIDENGPENNEVIVHKKFVVHKDTMEEKDLNNKQMMEKAIINWKRETQSIRDKIIRYIKENELETEVNKEIEITTKYDEPILETLEEVAQNIEIKETKDIKEIKEFKKPNKTGEKIQTDSVDRIINDDDEIIDINTKADKDKKTFENSGRIEAKEDKNKDEINYDINKVDKQQKKPKEDVLEEEFNFKNNIKFTDDEKYQGEKTTFPKDKEVDSILKINKSNNIPKDEKNKIDNPEPDKTFVLNQFSNDKINTNDVNEKVVFGRQGYKENEIIEQVINNAKVIITDDKSEMVITLKPETLGKLTLKVVTENGIVIAKFAAESQQVKEIIEANMQQLKDSLQNQGLSIQGFSVSVGQERKKDDPDEKRQSGKNGSKIHKDIKIEHLNMSRKLNTMRNLYMMPQSQIDITA